MVGSPATRERRNVERAEQQKTRRRRRLALAAGAVLVMIGAGAGLTYATNVVSAREYDLSAVGNGVPAVVQVHDVTCPICTELRGHVRSVEDEFANDELLFRIADVATAEGRAFAAEYTDQRRVTLLLFDGAGELTDIQSGIQTPDELRRAFRFHINQTGE